MVTDMMMRRHLVAIPPGGISTHNLAIKIGRSDSNVWKCMEVMRKLGIVGKKASPHGKNGRFVWVKLVHVQC